MSKYFRDLHQIRVPWTDLFTKCQFAANVALPSLGISVVVGLGALGSLGSGLPGPRFGAALGLLA